MKVSIITVTYNSAQTIADTLNSVADQRYTNIEHIIVDGASTDRTMEIVRQFPHVAKVISEKDSGMFNAMNKGIGMASGDVVGVLNSDDFLPDESIIQKIVAAFTSDIDMIIGDIAFVSPKNIQRVVRYYSSKNWTPLKFKWGFMPPHPSCYVRLSCYQMYGVYKEDYKISSDYELLIRFLYTKQVPYKYLPLQMVTMRLGGISTKNIRSRIILNQEIIRACRENGIYTNMSMLVLKYFTKVFEYFIHR